MIGIYDYTVILTYLSFLSGLTGIYFSLNGNTLIGIICIMVSGLFDMFDGKVARTKKNRTETSKKFGIQIDSLSDLVAFGLLPSAIGISLGLDKTILCFTLYLIPLCALIRLAYFNVDEEVRSSKTTEVRHEYLGLPVTTSAIVVPIIYLLKNIIKNNFVYVYGVVLLMLSILFITKFKMFKLKNRGMIIMTILGIIILTMLLIWYL